MTDKQKKAQTSTASPQAKRQTSRAKKPESKKKAGSAGKSKRPSAKRKTLDALAAKAENGRPRYVFVLPSFDASGSQSEAYAVAVVHELARRGNEILVITGKGSSDSEHVTIRRSNPLIMGRKAIKAFNPIHIIDWGYNIPAEFRRVGSPQEQILQHSIAACSGWKRLTKRWQLWFSRQQRQQIHEQRALMEVSKTRFLAQSDLVAEDLKRAGVGSGRIHVLPYGVDLKRFRPDEEAAKTFRSEQKLRSKNVIFLCAADDPHLFDIDLLRAVFSLAHTENPALRLVLTGDHNPGWKEPWFQYLPRQKNPAVAFAAADALIHPAVYDPGAATILQGMAAGLPVVTSENIGSLQFVKDSGGALFAPLGEENDTEAWAGAVTHLVNDAEKRKQLAAASRSAASTRSLGAFVDQLEDILK